MRKTKDRIVVTQGELRAILYRSDYDWDQPLNPDLGLLWKQVEWVELQDQIEEVIVRDGRTYHNPEREWFQGDWIVSVWSEERDVCGTARCVAGNVATMLGLPVWVEEFHEGKRYEKPVGIVYDPETDKYESMARFAQRKLGISANLAEQLFEGGNEASDIRHYAEWITRKACENWYGRDTRS
jgi:hypothetical protein